MASLAKSHVQEGLLYHHSQVLAQVVLSLVVDDLHVHVGLLLRVVIQLDVNVDRYAQPDVQDQVYAALD